jgi:hypothetical protein
MILYPKNTVGWGCNLEASERIWHNEAQQAVKPTKLPTERTSQDIFYASPTSFPSTVGKTSTVALNESTLS